MYLYYVRIYYKYLRLHLLCYQIIVIILYCNWNTYSVNEINKLSSLLTLKLYNHLNYYESKNVNCRYLKLISKFKYQ